MTIITLPPEIEGPLAEEAHRLGTTPTQAQLAQIKEDDLAMKAAIKQNIVGLADAQKDAMIVSLAEPEMM